MTDLELLAKASEARRMAYAPYSNYTVGAALLCADGKVYSGCNIENASFTPTVCAERCAIHKAVSEGEREFLKIAIVGGRREEADGFAPPCGVCRQVMAEFCRGDFEIILLKDGKPQKETLDSVMPLRFSL